MCQHLITALTHVHRSFKEKETVGKGNVFDQVQWDYPFYTLRQFGFGPRFISWIKVIYSSPLAAFHMNINSSPFFPLYGGSRHGCPLSHLLFAVLIEPLAAALWGQTAVKGLWRRISECKISLCTDKSFFISYMNLAKYLDRKLISEKVSSCLWN